MSSPEGKKIVLNQSINHSLQDTQALEESLASLTLVFRIPAMPFQKKNLSEEGTRG
jgi:hypothetical protein